MPKQTINKMLNGTRMISVQELSKIANYFDVSADSIVQEKIVSPIKSLIGEVKSVGGKNAIKIAERLMDIYSFHHKFQTKEFIDKCNQVWSDE